MNAGMKEDRRDGFDPDALRRQFAILNREVAWLDNAATTQRPESVLRAMDEFYRQHNANPRRSVHRLGAEATAAYEQAQAAAARFVGAGFNKIYIFSIGLNAWG